MTTEVQQIAMTAVMITAIIMAKMLAPVAAAATPDTTETVVIAMVSLELRPPTASPALAAVSDWRTKLKDDELPSRSEAAKRSASDKLLKPTWFLAATLN